jgi:hypothetical protein
LPATLAKWGKKKNKKLQGVISKKKKKLQGVTQNSPTLQGKKLLTLLFSSECTRYSLVKDK